MAIDRFTKEEFEECLEEIREEWRCDFLYGEYRYQIRFGENGVVFVNSSIGRDGRAKTTGSDSIRVWVEYEGKPIKKSQRWTTRLPGWRDRLKDRLSEAFKIINDMDHSPRCPQCGGRMVLRSGVHGRFYGCLNFPRCRGTRNYSADVPEELEFIKG